MGAEDMGASVYPRRFRDRLASAAPLVLDGATGTELERRGIACDAPLWSAHALLGDTSALEAVHRDYRLAGAEILTANTFRTQRRCLAHAGLGEEAGTLTRRAVEIARAAADRDVFVAGSIATLEDCWRPDLVPGDEALAREHAEHATHLAAAGVDLLLIETMNTIREACAALRAAKATGLPVGVSFACDAAAKLLSGEPLAEALAAVGALDADLVGVNCLPPSHVGAAIGALQASQRPFAVYANLGAPRAGTGGARTHDETPAEFAAHAQNWVAQGARIIGGCCGTRPAHIHAIASGARTSPAP
jgi:S-methylmethionine-dependent homocysteine/selenocysteine methylase